MDIEQPYNRELQREEPTIVQIGDISLIGVVHFTDLTDQTPSHQVMEIVGNAEHLLIEGKKRPSRADATSKNYELTTSETFQNRGKEADIYMLDEGVNFATLAEKYGLSESEYIFFGNYINASFAIDGFVQRYGVDDLSKSKFTDTLIQALVAETEEYSQMPREEIQRIVERVVTVDRDLVQNEDKKTRALLKIAAFGVNDDFLARIRDSEVLYPRIRGYDERLPGEKAVIVGSSHIPHLSYALEHGGLPSPYTWPQYQKSLRKIDKTAICTFEMAMGNNREVKPWYRRLS